MSGQLYTAYHTAMAAGTKVILIFVLTPVLAGLAGAVLPATGWFPPLGGDAISLSPLRTFLLEPGLITSVSLSIFTALTATTLSYFVGDRSAGGSGRHRRGSVSDPFDLTAAFRPTYNRSGGFFISAAA